MKTAFLMAAIDDGGTVASHVIAGGLEAVAAGDSSGVTDFCNGLGQAQDDLDKLQTALDGLNVGIERRIGSHVPHKSLAELRAAYMPDVTRAVSGIPRADPEGRVTPPVLTSSNPLSTLLQRFTCARLSQPCLPGSRPNVSRTAHHHGS